MTTIFVPKGGYRQTNEKDYCDLDDAYVSELVFCRNGCETCATDCIFLTEKEGV